MSWITDLAGKAENILNKIDQNAASVLKTETIENNVNNNSNGIKDATTTTKVDESIVEGLKRNLSSNSLSLTKTLSPKKLLKSIDLQNSLQRLGNNDETTSQKSEKPNSKLSSRRSSLSSKETDGTTVIEYEISSNVTDSPLLANKQQQQQSVDYNVKNEIADLRITLAEITSERNDLKDEIIQLQQDIKEASGYQRIQELEQLILDLKSERDNLSTEIIEMKNNCKYYVKSITELDMNLSKARQTILELSEKLDWQIKETNQHITEFEQYRIKAQATLQMKDKIISELRNNEINKNHQINNNDNDDDNNSNKILQMEIDELKNENFKLNEKLNLSYIQLDDMRNALKNMN